MTVDWLNPVLAALEHRQTIWDTVRDIVNRIRSKPRNIAVTGMPGVGKTVLLDYLTGKAFHPNYTPPLRSQKLEQASVPRKGILLQVVPGQDALPRSEAFDSLFLSKTAVDGVIHVVANGFASLREPAAVATLQKRYDDVANYREYMLSLEIEDLVETCQVLRDSHRRHHKPAWMLVAVDKIDLYHGTITDAQERYSPDRNRKFANRLTELTDQIGSDFFRWEPVPICGHLEEFTWAGDTLKPQLDTQRRNAYLAQFLRQLEEYCGK